MTRVVVVGGGVGALEAALALRKHLGPLVQIDLVAPDDALVYRPLAVAEPFGYAAPNRLPFGRLERTHGVRHLRDRLEEVDAPARRARLRAGGWSAYDALLVAVGARAEPWLPDALTFGVAGGVEAYRSLLNDIAGGRVASVGYVMPPAPSWPLPLYELALLTAAWSADQGLTRLELQLATSEAAPLDVFGPAAARAVRDLLGDRGVRLHARRAEVEADRIVTLPRLSGPRLAGLPADAAGFIPVGLGHRVVGHDGVWAIGDATSSPIKHGGLAAHQADVAAAAIADEFGMPVPRLDHEVALRGVLLTGLAPMFLRGPSATTHPGVAFHPVWFPPAKVIGRHLAPYLAREAALVATPVVADRATGGDPAVASSDTFAELALEFAEADAAHGQPASALQWLETVEWLGGELPQRAAARRAHLMHVLGRT